MKIERAAMEDLKAILDLQYLAYQTEAEALDDFSIPPLQQTLTEVKAEFESGIILKATAEDGTLIGSVRGYIKGNTLYIGKLMVHPIWRGQGIGSQLLKKIESISGKRRYELFTNKSSLWNIRLYEQAGYRLFKEELISRDLTFVYLEKSFL